MKKNVLKISGLSLLTLLSWNAQAQIENEQIQSLDAVVVLSTRLQIPYSQQNRNIEILTQQDIQQLPVKSVPELLTFVAGLDVRQRGPNGTQADIGIDGGTFDQTLVLINGVKVSDPQTGHNMMALSIPLSAIERIEILKGAAANFYGVNAMMGVINIVTQQEKGNHTYAHVYAGSSFQQDDSNHKTYLNYGIEATQTLQTGKHQHLIAAGIDKGNGYRYNTAYQNSKVFYKGDIDLNAKTQLELQAGYADYHFGANAFYAAPADKNAIETVRNAHFALRLPIVIHSHWTSQPYLQYRYGYDHYIFIQQKPEVYQNIHHTNTWNAGWDNTFHYDWGSLATGLQWRQENINSTNLGERKRNNAGLFVAYKNSWDAFDLNAGLYLNHNSVFGTKLYPGIDIGYHLDENWKLYANAGMGQRLPTFTDLYYSGPANIGNDSLQPESMTTYELGLRFQDQDSRANAAVFYRQGQDFIDWIRADSLQAWRVYNFTQIQTLGFHIDYMQSIALNSNTKLNLQTAYTYLYPTLGKIKDASMQHYQSQYAINNLKHQWIIRASVNLSDRFEISVGNKFLQRYGTATSTTTAKVGQYNLLDARLQYQWQSWRVSFDVNNIGNVQYIETGVVPLPGRWFTLGLHYQY